MSGSRTPLVEPTAPWSEVYRALVRVQKSNRNAPAYSRWINRPVGRVLATTGYRLSLTPDAISVLSAGFTYGALGIVAVSAASIPVGILVSALLVVGYALDSADGQVARLRGGGTLAGEWLDHVFDAIKCSGFHLAIAVMWFRNLGSWPLWTVLLPLVFALQASVWFFGLIVTDLLLRNAGVKKPAMAVDEGRQSILASLAGIPADYGVLCLVMALLGWFDGWRVVYGVLALMNVLLLLVQLVRWHRRLTAV